MSVNSRQGTTTAWPDPYAESPRRSGPSLVRNRDDDVVVYPDAVIRVDRPDGREYFDEIRHRVSALKRPSVIDEQNVSFVRVAPDLVQRYQNGVIHVAAAGDSTAPVPVEPESSSATQIG